MVHTQFQLFLHPTFTTFFCRSSMPQRIIFGSLKDQRIYFSCEGSGNEAGSYTKRFTELLGFKDFMLKKYEYSPEFECCERAKENSRWIFIKCYTCWLFQKTARGQFWYSNINRDKRFLVLISDDVVLHATTKPQNFHLTPE